MEKLYSHETLFFLLLLILQIQFLPSFLLSSAYTLPDQYFINCGSDSDTTFGNRSFLSDNSFYEGPKNSLTSNSSSSGTQLYQTARVFYKDISFYLFNIHEAGTYMVRLRFFVFLSPANLTSALFNVWAGGFSLLSDFSIAKNSSNSPVVEEFLLTLPQGPFRIYFMPSNKRTIAFVNAIEVFVVPPNFLPNATSHLTSGGSNGNYDGLLNKALRKIYRINVGGDYLTPENDTMLRNWIPDDEFLTNPPAATVSRIEGSIAFLNSLASEYIAPDAVYKTARVLNTAQGGSFTNITWTWKVRNATCFVRAHFYDLIGPATDLLKFNLYINGKFAKEIYPYNVTDSSNFPFYFDFAVDLDVPGFLNVSVHVNPKSWNPSAFLNGLEIMEVMEKSGRDPWKGNSEKNRSSHYVLAGSLGGSALLLILLLIILVVLKKNGFIFAEKTPGMSLDLDVKLALRLRYAEIMRATKNFDSELLIGQGGFGKVYEGTLDTGLKVAVKRSEPGYGQGLKEFQTEIITLSQIRHRHLVALIGYCDKRSEMILVYEYMEKGTLRDHLYFIPDDNSDRWRSRSELSWEQRLQICIDSARGLHYLHTGLKTPIIHSDVKSTNILLSEDYTAKVADFGLSRSDPPGQDSEFTGFKGSIGYIDPEYVMSLQLTEKSDVYSFGVVLLEVLCARPAIITSDYNEETSLAEWGMLWLRKGQLEDIIDPALVGKIKPNSLRKFGETTKKCLSRSSMERPDMRDVLWDLEASLCYQQGVAHRELQEESISDASFELPLLLAQCLPSRSSPVNENDPSFGIDDSSSAIAGGAFSNLRTNGGR